MSEKNFIDDIQHCAQTMETQFDLRVTCRAEELEQRLIVFVNGEKSIINDLLHSDGIIRSIQSHNEFNHYRKRLRTATLISIQFQLSHPGNGLPPPINDLITSSKCLMKNFR